MPETRRTGFILLVLAATSLLPRTALADGRRERPSAVLDTLSTFANPFDPAWVESTKNSEPHTIYAYAWPQSVAPGDTLSIYVSSISPTVRMRVMRIGETDAYVADSTGDMPGVPAGVQLVPSDPGINSGVWSTGCEWTPTLRVVVPESWTSAPYYVEIWPENGEPSTNRQYATFIVRNPQPTDSILVVLSTSTWWAYEAWGGRSLYDAEDRDRTHVASMQRPASAISGRGQFVFWDLPWVRFLAHAGLAVDYATMEDLQSQGQALLDRYSKVVFVGHSEYWSELQRDAVEGYIAAGGDVLFGTGNICWWRTEYSPDLTQIICYKGDNVIDADGGTRGIPPGQQYAYSWYGPHPLHASTYNWRYAPANRGAYSMTGVEWWDATEGSMDSSLPGPTDWTVRDTSFWGFQYLGLVPGQRLGATHLLHDEIDGLLMSWSGSPADSAAVPVISSDAYSRGTPSTFHIVATCDANMPGRTHADLPRWGVFGWYQRPGQGKVVTLAERNLGIELWDTATGLGNLLLRKIVLNVLTDGGPTPDLTLDVGSAGPTSFSVRCSPNPVSAASGGTVSIAARIRAPSPYTFLVESPAGRAVVVERGALAAGSTVRTWKIPRALAPGIYFWRLRTRDGEATGKIAWLR